MAQEDSSPDDVLQQAGAKEETKMNPTNVMTMHEVVKAERARDYANLEMRRHVNEARAARQARQAHPAARPEKRFVARAHHRLAVAAGTVALLLAMLAGAVVASAPGPDAPAAAPDHGRQFNPHGPRVE